MQQKEEEFIVYWEANRLIEKKGFKQYLKGLTRGIAIGIAIFILLVSGWYTRANMQANAKLSYGILTIALLGIALFMSWLYQQYQWEMKEQQYLELLAKKKKEMKSNDKA